jgi:AbiV family abortive infection protein
MPTAQPRIAFQCAMKLLSYTENMSEHLSSKRYTGPLTPAQAAAGIDVATRTARGLLGDAELLLENKRWERATALAILAIEEMGKVEILRSILLARDAAELEMEWRAYRSHMKKNLAWIFLDLVRMGARKLEEFKPIFDTRSGHGKFLNAVKQESFYSNISDEGEWLSPEQRIKPELAGKVFIVARTLVREGPSAMTSEAELKLWVRHLSPVWRGTIPEMKKALAACYAEAEAKGVLQGKTTAAEMLSFLYEDSTSLEQ